LNITFLSWGALHNYVQSPIFSPPPNNILLSLLATLQINNLGPTTVHCQSVPKRSKSTTKYILNAHIEWIARKRMRISILNHFCVKFAGEPQCDDSEPGLSWQVNSHLSSWNMVKLVWLHVLTAARPICTILTLFIGILHYYNDSKA
jgi:hypothetical protein